MTFVRHLATVAWLRITILKNQFLKLTIVSRIMTGLLLAIIGFSMFGTVGGIFTASRILFPAEVPWWIPYLWDGLVAVFLAAWLLSVWMDLKQSEALTLSKFLHLPMRPQQVVWLNYAATLISLNLVYFFPSMLALGCALGLRYGGWYWLTPLLVLAFFFMVTAVTWLFRSWLVSLMSNQRRRRLVIAAGSFLIGLLFLIPYTLQTISPNDFRARNQRFSAEQLELIRQRSQGEIDDQAFVQAMEQANQRRLQERQQRRERWLAMLDQVNRYLPVAWLPGGITAIQRNQPAAAGLALFGMLALGALALVWGTRQTIAMSLLDTGDHQNRRRKLASGNDRPQGNESTDNAPKPAIIDGASPRSSNWIEANWLWLTPTQTAVALATLRSYSRSPEIKIAVLVWFVLVGVMAAALNAKVVGSGNEWINALLGLGVCFIASTSVNQLIANQFGFDRDGFRSYLLLPISTRDLLLGKNMAILPVGLLLGWLALLVLQFFVRMEWSHLVANAFQLITIMFINFFVNNLLSIVTPLTVKPGSLQPRSIGVTTAFLQLAIFALLPLLIVPCVVPLGVEWWFRESPILGKVPWYLLGSILGTLAAVGGYYAIINSLASLLQARRHKIAEVVTKKE